MTQQQIDTVALWVLMSNIDLYSGADLSSLQESLVVHLEKYFNGSSTD